MKKSHLYLVALTIILSGIFATVSGQNISNTGSFNQINIDGFGSTNNLAARGIEIFNGSLVIATTNYNEDSLIAFGKQYGIQEFLDTYNSLYRYEYGLKSDGFEIWTYNGSSWRQIVGNGPEAIMPAGFGNENNSELGFLIEFKGMLYAGVRNIHEGAQLWRTNSINSSWEMVADNGFGKKNNTGCWSAEEFYGCLYVGTINFHWNGEVGGCEVFRSFDGETWEAVVGGDSDTEQGFMMPEGRGMNFYAWSMANYSGCLYVGTSFPGEVYKTTDGVNWEPFMAYENYLDAWSNGAKIPRHFGLHYGGGIRRMQVFKGELYMFTAQSYGKMGINIKGLGRIIEGLSSNFKFLKIRYDQLKYYLAGTQIWKYNSTTDSLTKVVGGFGLRGMKSGFGDLQNTYLWSVTSDEEYLYVGTSHPDSTDVTFTRNGLFDWSFCMDKTKGHGQIWRYDGKNWMCLVGKGIAHEFEDEYNVGFRELTIYKDILFGSTMNVNTGVEVWEVNS